MCINSKVLGGYLVSQTGQKRVEVAQKLFGGQVLNVSMVDSEGTDTLSRLDPSEFSSLAQSVTFDQKSFSPISQDNFRVILQTDDGQFSIAALFIQVKEMYVVQKGNTGLIKKTVPDHDVFHGSYSSLSDLEHNDISVGGMQFTFSQRKGVNMQFT